MQTNIDDILKDRYKIDEKFFSYFENDERYINVVVEFNNMDEFNEFNKDIYDVINIKSILNDNELSLINCSRYCEESSNNKIRIKYRVDRISEFVIKNINDSIFYNITFSLDDINWFVLDETNYSFDPVNENVKFNNFIKSYNVSFGKITIYRLFSFAHKTNEFKINDDIAFNIEFNKEITYAEVIEKVYCLRNLLSIFGRRHLNVVNMFTTNKEKEYRIIDCYKEYNHHPINDRYREYLDHHTLTLNSLKDFSLIINKYYEEYHRMLPIIDSWFSNVKFQLPPRVRFINLTTMIEDFANIYLKRKVNEESEIEAKEIKHKFIEKIFNAFDKRVIITDIDKKEIEQELIKVVKDTQSTFIIKTKALINNVNEIFNYKSKEIEIITKNIRNARLACIHKGIYIDETKLQYIAKYSDFIEDVIFLNILKVCGSDLQFNEWKCIEYNYQRDDLTYPIKFKK